MASELKAEKSEAEDISVGGGEPAGGGMNKKVIIAVLSLILLLGGGAGAYFTGLLDGLLGKHAPDCTQVKEGDEHYEDCMAAGHAAEGAAAGPGVFIAIPDMIVNLTSTAKQPRFLKVSLKVELEKAEDQAKFETVLPRVIDQFQTYLRELRIEDLRGSSGMYRMKIELLSRVRAAAPDLEVHDVLFQEILVQ